MSITGTAIYDEEEFYDDFYSALDAHAEEVFKYTLKEGDWAHCMVRTNDGEYEFQLTDEEVTDRVLKVCEKLTDLGNEYNNMADAVVMILDIFGASGKSLGARLMERLPNPTISH